MRIGIILSQRLGQTGSGVYSINLAEGLRMCGHDVRLLAAGPFEAHQGCDITPVPFADGSGSPPFPVPGMSDVMPYESSVFADLDPAQIDQYLDHWTKHIVNFLDRGLDVVHVNHWWLVASLVVSLSDVPVVVTIHGTDLEQWIRCKNLVRLAKLDRTHPQLFHAVSLNVKNRAIHLGLGTANDAVILPPPIREDIFNISSTDAPGRIGTLVVGKLSERKGVLELIRAFKEVRVRFSDATLTVVGSAPMAHNRWTRTAEELGVRQGIQFVGFLEQDRLAEEYKKAEILVVPSWDEGYSLVAIESASCGAAVVMPRYGSADLLLSECLTESQLYLLDALVDTSSLEREKFSERLAMAWIRALSSGPRTGNLKTQNCLLRKTGRRAVAEQIVKRCYQPLLE